ncbi:hypothetical protein ACJ41O_004471 [Fusarium nematophilum]
MCIQVNRWFYCPVRTSSARSPAQPPCPSQHSPANPAANWAHEDAVSPLEAEKIGLPGRPGYSYVRHKVESWVRCALIRAPHCRDYPQELRTEVYSISCPQCTNDDRCVLSQRPVLTGSLDNPNGMPLVIENAIVAAYYSEVASLLRSYLLHDLNYQPLDEKSWQVHMLGQYCTENGGHLYRDHPSRLHSEECERECGCTNNPGAHNLARALRIREGQVLRMRFPLEWFPFAAEDRRNHNRVLGDFYANGFAHVPNQDWLNYLPDYDHRYQRLVSQIADQMSGLIRLGPTVEGASPSAPTWREVLETREFLASELIYYPASDPGVTDRFLENLMRNHILTVLCPDIDLNEAPPHWRGLICQRRAEDAATQDLIDLYGRLQGNYQSEGEIYRARMRRDELATVLERNRGIAFKNVLIRQRLADSFIRGHEVTGAELWALSSDDDGRVPQTCVICAEDFDTTNLQVPEHLRCVRIPCCSQYIHARCFKGVTRAHKNACPYCNESFASASIGLDPEKAGRNWRWDERLEELPAGMSEEPSAHQQRQFEFLNPLLLAMFDDQ